MHHWHTLCSFLKHLLTARTRYYVHSPFVFELLNDAIYDKRSYYAFEEVECLREQMIQSNEQIETIDLGAGSQKSNLQQTRKVSDIARVCAASPLKGRLLFRLVRDFQPRNVLELGTSLGIGTAYMALAKSTMNLISIEGCPQTANLARKNKNALQLNNVQIETGNFADILPLVLPKLASLDMVFFDGNHRQEPTLSYFETCLPYCNEQTVLVFDDIHWSQEMEQTWEKIKQHPQITVTIDLYVVGLAFFRTKQAKEDFKFYFW